MDGDVAAALDGNNRVRLEKRELTVMPRSKTKPAHGIQPEAAAEPAPRVERRIPTMQDIARASGVSQSTVSRVLTGAPNAVPISPATKERVLEVARRMRYRPNPLARGLRGARTQLLGVIVREIMDPFFAGAMDALSTEANRYGYNVVLGHAHGRTDEAIALRRILETRHCDAILLVGDTSDQPRLLADLREANVPVVGLWEGTVPIEGISIIAVDNRAGINSLMDHLLSLGHRRIGFIGGAFVGGRLIGDTGERRTAFLERAAAEGLSTPPDYVRDARNTLAGGAGALRELMGLSRPPTAVIASTDQLAIGALHEARHMGLDVPGDISVVGFDDLPMAEYTTPSLTTVRMPTTAMAAAAVAAAITERLDYDAATLQVLEPTIVVRESTGPMRVLDAETR
jgi:DNA-binding LacI/PurR family transcriptional regulator